MLNAANRRFPKHRDSSVRTSPDPAPRRHGAAGRPAERSASIPSPPPSSPLPTRESRDLPEITPEELTPELLRGAILEHRRLLVRGLMDPREGASGWPPTSTAPSRSAPRPAGRASTDPDGYYDELEPEPPFIIGERAWIEEGGGVLAADSPRLLFDMLESFEEAGLRSVIEAVPRRAPGDLGPEVHAAQGDARRPRRLASGRRLPGRGPLAQRLALALALRRRGAEHGRGPPAARRVRRRPGPRAPSSTSRSPRQVAEEAAGDVGIVRPIFDPGRRAPVRRRLPAPDGLRPVDAESALRDRELVLRSVRLPGRLRADRLLSGS